ncbi:hypothetical protein AB4P91_19365 [Pseudomonas sp. B21128]|jgi:hypothetical protein|uniref:Addiction module protein n=1 Tax=Pseudomonas fluorescens TaxID=294 RepID=A0ABD7VD52_PSEFL|nr:hypothetical protein [Pseudomonas fluorescens]WKV98476.1 hypothetical protein PYV50_09820 [Pseudomonas sp. H22_DOA]VVO49850.1 hypothetical protein PS876_00230 [Pseudomonas fluorescens]VVO72305.1 hypothetical protein PS732_01392 [Pseudomonas fluorescens]VVP67234.1 hypothetical protein PS906_01404 [Pseudomonas fluorescens]
MNAYKNLLSDTEVKKLAALDRWHAALDDVTLRRDNPDGYHEELIRRADELDRLGKITFEEWRTLRLDADQAWLRAVSGDDYR